MVFYSYFYKGCNSLFAVALPTTMVEIGKAAFSGENYSTSIALYFQVVAINKFRTLLSYQILLLLDYKTTQCFKLSKHIFNVC